MTNYWQNRFLENSKEIFRKDEEYVKEISKLYNQAINDLEGQISKILNSMDEVSLHEAKKIMNNTESKVFKEGLKRFEELSKGTLTKDIEKELQTIYKRSRISRLQAMQLSLKTQISKVLNQEEKRLFAHLSNTFTSTYYKDLYMLQRIKGFEKISGLSEDFINTIIKTKWASDGKDFSSRIWQRKDKLINTLNTDLKIDLITGKPINAITNNISKKLEVSKNNAKRLVRTESSAIHSISRKNAYKRMGVEKYQIIATLDLKTSEICRGMDGKVFNYIEREEGVTAPPFHCNCRTTDAPYFDDDLQDIIEGRTRIARDLNTGKSVKVEDITYDKWYKKYVKGDKEKTKNTNNKTSQNNKLSLKSGFTKGLADISEIKSNNDIKAFAEQLIDNLNIDRTNISVSVKNIWHNGHCVISQNTTQNIINYEEYVLNASDKRSIKHRLKTAFYESFLLFANGMEWDGLNSSRQIKEAWRSLEETFTESSAHYMLREHGVTEKIAPSYSKELVTNLPRLKRLQKYSSCNTIEDFGKIAFTDRQNGVGAKWIDLSKKMKRVKLADDYYKQYHEYIINNEDDLFDMFLENMPGYEQYRKSMKVDLKIAMGKDRVFLSENEEIVYYGILSCAMQKVGIK